MLINVLGAGVLLLFAAFSCGHALKIADSPSGFASADPNDPKYIVAFASPETSVPEFNELKVRTSIITQRDGSRYRCLLPRVNETDDDSSRKPLVGSEVTNADDTEVAKQVSNQKTPFQLLEKAEGRCLFRQEGLWMYEMCFRKHLRQFRHDEAKEESFVCGVYLGDDVQSSEIKVDASASGYPFKYVRHVLGKGSTCHLTGQERTAEVRFTCMRDVTDLMITGIKEFPTCNYIVTVSVPFLCSHPEFKLKPDPLHLIGCYPLDAKPADEPAPQQLSQQLSAAPTPASNAPVAQSAQPPAESPTPRSHDSKDQEPKHAGDKTLGGKVGGAPAVSTPEQEVKQADRGQKSRQTDPEEAEEGEEEDDDIVQELEQEGTESERMPSGSPPADVHNGDSDGTDGSFGVESEDSGVSERTTEVGEAEDSGAAAGDGEGSGESGRTEGQVVGDRTAGKADERGVEAREVDGGKQCSADGVAGQCPNARDTTEEF